MKTEGTSRARLVARKRPATPTPSWPALVVSGGALLLGGLGITGALHFANRSASAADAAVVAPPVAEAPFLWDGKDKPRFAVGQKYFVDAESEDKKQTTVALGAEVHRDPDLVTRTSFRYTGEVLAADGGKASETRIKIERWRESTSSGDDLTLQGVSVLVKHVGAVRSFEIEDRGVKLTPGALDWLEGELAKKGKPDEAALDKALDPPHAVKDGEEWDGDPQAFFTALRMTPLDIDLARSKIKGKLTNVHVENAVHLGHVRLEYELALRAKDGQGTGSLTGTLEVDQSLEADKRNQESGSHVVVVEATRNQPTARGTAIVKFRTETTTTRRKGPL